jgi:2-hydroxychromene-2-carboxylate isomerase
MLHNIPYVQPQPFPIGTVSAARAVIYLKQHDSANVADFIKAAYRAYFAEGRNISETETVLAIADSLGIDARKLAGGIAQDDIKQRLKQEIDAAMARGVFGSPFMFVDGEPFWGFDRFDHIRRWLRRE